MPVTAPLSEVPMFQGHPKLLLSARVKTSDLQKYSQLLMTSRLYRGNGLAQHGSHQPQQATATVTEFPGGGPEWASQPGMEPHRPTLGQGAEPLCLDASLAAQE